MKKNDMESEEERKMEGQQNCYHGYNKYINGSHGYWIVQCLAHAFYFLLKYDQIEKSHGKETGFDGMLSKRDKNFKSFSKLLFRLRL